MSPKVLYLNKNVFMRMRQCISIVVLMAFVGTCMTTPIYAQMVDPMPRMPLPGIMVHLSPEFTPAILKGIIIHPENALKFDFIIYKGDQPLDSNQKKQEYTKLMKYFLASLAVPDNDQWVNLSPYEKDRIIRDDFGKTEMGRDLLAQDYLLKQITSSLIYPQDNLGREFWDKVYERAYKEYGTTQVPVNTFNKVWIVPDDAVIYEKGNMAYCVKNHLKVMLEEDYLSLQKHNGISTVPSKLDNTHTIGSQVIKEIILPELEKEVNEGKNFAPLRQVFSGMVLAAWYKRALRESLLGQIYMNKNKVRGIDQNPQTNRLIYQQYLKAFKKGVFNFIKEDADKYTNEVIPRKYFSGGAEDLFNTYAGTAKDIMHRETALTPEESMNEAMLVSDEELASAAMTTVKPAVNSQVMTEIMTDRGPRYEAEIKAFADLRPGKSYLETTLTEGMRRETWQWASLLPSGTIFVDPFGLLWQMSFNGNFLEMIDDDGKPSRIRYNLRDHERWNPSPSAIATLSMLRIERMPTEKSPVFFNLDEYRAKIKDPIYSTDLERFVGLVQDLFTRNNNGPIEISSEELKELHITHARFNQIQDALDYFFLLGGKQHIEMAASDFSAQDTEWKVKLQVTNAAMTASPERMALQWESVSTKEMASLTVTHGPMKQTLYPFEIKIQPTFSRLGLEVKLKSTNAAAFRGRNISVNGVLIPENKITYGSKEADIDVTDILNNWNEQGRRLPGVWVDEYEQQSPRFSARPIKLTGTKNIVVSMSGDEILDVKMEIVSAKRNHAMLSLKTGKLVEGTIVAALLAVLVVDGYKLFQQAKSQKQNTSLNQDSGTNLVSINSFPTNNILPSNQAMAATKGGIDLNAANLHFFIKRDGHGVPLPVAQQDFERIHINGLVPVILSIKPAMSSPLLSQLAAGQS